jgi:hypothetical protein
MECVTGISMPYLLHVDHNIAIHLRILLLVEPTIC